MSNSNSPLRQWEGHSLVVVPIDILSAVDNDGKALSGTAIRLWIALASFANSQHECWPSNRTLEAMMPEGTSRRTIQRAKQELVNAGLVTVTPRLTDAGRQTSDLYCLYAPEGDNTDTPEGGETVTDGNDQIVTVEGDDTVIPLTVNNELNQKEKVIKVFNTWCEATGKNPNRTKLDAKRKRLIEKALESYPEKDVLAAVVGWKNSSFHTGRNDRNKVYNDLSLLLRDASKIEQFRDMAYQGKTPEMGASWSVISEILEEEQSELIALPEGK
jgi:hypothetical protein